jgi:hypothetical protein
MFWRSIRNIVPHQLHSYVEPMPLSEHPFGAILPIPNGKLQCSRDMGQFRDLGDERSNMKLPKD